MVEENSELQTPDSELADFDCIKISAGLRMFFFVFKVNSCSNCHDCYANHKNNKVFHNQSSFTGVTIIAATKIIAAIITVITIAEGFIGFSDRSTIAPTAVSRYFTRSNIRFATFSFFRKNLSFITDGLVKSRHTREGGYPESLQLLEKTGFPIKDFGNDGLKKGLFTNVS